MPELTLVEAVRAALARAMADDPAVLVLGEDVGRDGGVFRATDGLLARFGEERVLDTPLSEALLAGLGVGLAAQGFRPVVEYQFTGFIYPAIDQLVNHAGRLRNRTRGRLSCPMVVRAPCGGGIRAPEHHSESPEAMFAHIPGIRTVVPSSPRRAYGLLLAAIRDPDPVVFLEPTRLYRAIREEVADDGAALPLDRCFILREGRDLTLVTWGATTRDVLAAADTLAAEGIPRPRSWTWRRWRRSTRRHPGTRSRGPAAAWSPTRRRSRPASGRRSRHGWRARDCSPSWRRSSG